MKKRKRYWEMNAEELAEATRQFDDPSYDPPSLKPTAKQQARLRRWQRKREAERSKLVLSLDQNLINQADEYAAEHGITFSDLVSNALKRVMGKKSA